MQDVTVVAEGRALRQEYHKSFSIRCIPHIMCQLPKHKAQLTTQHTLPAL